MENNLDSFLEYLSDRICHENNVSDIIYAFLKSNIAMQTIFSKLFGMEISTETEIIREYPTKYGRPDFVLINNDLKSVLIEIKLFDQKQHFEDYKNIIINGKIIPTLFLLGIEKPTSFPPDSDRWTWIAWSQIIKEIKKINDPLFQALLHYLEKVTKMEKYDAVNMNEPIGLRNLNYMMKDIIRNYKPVSDDIQITFEKTRFSETESGYYYSIKGTKDKEAYIFFGLVYNDWHKGFMLYLEKDSNPYFDNIAKIWDELYKDRQKDYYYRIIKECGVQMPENEQVQFFKSNNNKIEQKEILSNFFEKFNGAIVKELFLD